MKKVIDKELIEKFNNSICGRKIKKISNILNKTNILQASYNSQKYNDIKNHFIIDLIGLPVENQKQSGRCWLYAATNLIREQIAKKLNLEDFSLSNSYLAFWDKIERSNFFLESIIKNIDVDLEDRLIQHFLNVGIEDGGQWDMVVNLIEKYGIVPNSAMQDHYHAANTKIINYLLNWKLRDFACELKNEKNKSTENLLEKKEKMIEEIFKLLEIFYGTPPKKFDFVYTNELKEQSQYSNSYKTLSRITHIDKNLTPLDFYNKYVDIKLDQYISIINAPQKSKNFLKIYSFDFLNNVVGKNQIVHINLQYEIFCFLILKQLISKKPVWFGADVRWFFDRDSGIWDDQMFSIEKLFDTNFDIQKGDMLTYNISYMTHAMLIVGANLNIDEFNKLQQELDNKITFENFKNKFNSIAIERWKIENSWGPGIGDWGYFIISESWFEKYVYQAVVLKKDLQEILEKLNLTKIENMEKVILNPWDPIGTLAKKI